jgi:two-component system chemotaxis sensor kinase CheA
VIEGEDTEIDRTLIEGLSDPLTHILRNAVDHGLETPSDRCALGKAPQGIVRISARHRAGRVVVEVADDGAGINRTRVRQIAIERGLIALEAQLSDDEVDQLIFLPGFSTASAVSAVSGRGVGMDVVKCAIQSLGGRVLLHSVSGVGTTVTISLPLTLAVLDGMVVTACSQTFVAPLTSVLEAIPLKPGDLQRVGADLEVLALRGLRVPAIDLASALGLRATPTNGLVRFALVVEDDTGRRAALLVDEIQDQRQIVIKSLETNYRNVDGVAAATILGEGKVALILDVDTILASARRSEFAPPRLAASR